MKPSSKDILNEQIKKTNLLLRNIYNSNEFRNFLKPFNYFVTLYEYNYKAIIADPKRKKNEWVVLANIRPREIYEKLNDFPAPKPIIATPYNSKNTLFINNDKNGQIITLADYFKNTFGIYIHPQEIISNIYERVLSLSGINTLLFEIKRSSHKEVKNLFNKMKTNKGNTLNELIEIELLRKDD